MVWAGPIAPEQPTLFEGDHPCDHVDHARDRSDRTPDLPRTESFERKPGHQYARNYPDPFTGEPLQVYPPKSPSDFDSLDDWGAALRSSKSLVQRAAAAASQAHRRSDPAIRRNTAGAALDARPRPQVSLRRDADGAGGFLASGGACPCPLGACRDNGENPRGQRCAGCGRSRAKGRCGRDIRSAPC
jgi:hypothetical protein